MTRPIVHIGFPKTATTWFQKTFYPNVRGRTYVEREAVIETFLEANALTFDASAARSRLALADDAVPILCEEGLSGYLHHGGVNEAMTRFCAEAVKAVFPDADIVIFVRAQPAILASTYQQYVRAGGTHSPERYLFPSAFLSGNHTVRYKIPLQDLAHFAYQNLILFYRELFGAERVHVFAFEALRKDGFLEHFAERLELDVDWDRLSRKRKLRSQPLDLLRLTRVMNLFTYRGVLDKSYLVHIPGWFDRRKEVLRSLRLRRTRRKRRAPSPRQLLGEDVVRWIEWRFAADNRALAELTGLPLGELGWALDAPEAPFPVKTSRWRDWYRR